MEGPRSLKTFPRRRVLFEEGRVFIKDFYEQVILTIFLFCFFDVFRVISFFSPGIPGTVFNGVCDWVYEEEVISDTRAVWFSPDGKHVAWIEFNDTEVDLMPLEIYGQPGRLEFQYPIPTPLRYSSFYNLDTRM